MSKDWTIDTCVLYEAVNLNYDAIELINRIKREKHAIALDYNEKGKIGEQYKNCFEKNKGSKSGEFINKWFTLMKDRKQIKYYPYKLSEKHKKEFRKLKFSEKDFPFVAVCSQTISKDLVTKDDKDYTINVKNYLYRNMKINVLSIKNALEK